MDPLILQIQDECCEAPKDPWRYERLAWAQGHVGVVGIDEAGRGCLAGPVVAAAVALPVDFNSEGIRDSKEMTPAARDRVFEKIMSEATAVGVGVIGPEVIDEINILKSTHCAMRASLENLDFVFDFILVDGLAVPDLPAASLAIVKGDSKSVSIGAASIVAKVTRDRIMIRSHLDYPVYGFAVNKGYGTREHLAALDYHGPCAIHRRTFAPISERVENCRLPGLG